MLHYKAIYLIVRNFGSWITSFLLFPLLLESDFSHRIKACDNNIAYKQYSVLYHDVIADKIKSCI